MVRSREWTDAEDEQIRECLRGGSTPWEAAKMLVHSMNRSQRAIDTRARRLQDEQKESSRS